MGFGSGFSASVKTTAANLVSSGVTTVVAAYNDGADAVNYSHASTPSVIIVGASTIDDTKAYYSDYGPDHVQGGGGEVHLYAQARH